MSASLFEVLAPGKWHLPVVFNSPHSGQLMPEGLLAFSQLTPAQLRRSEDCYVDLLFGGCLDSGAPMLRALASRAYLDLNREPFELDQRMFDETLPGYMNPDSARVSAGLGTLPRIVGDEMEIYRTKIPLSEAMKRIETFYKPYHRTLTSLLHEAEGATGFVLLVDCHSMPSGSVSRHAGNSKQADVVIGDRYGRSAAPEISDAIHSYFESRGLQVVRNKPYAGGFITETHGAPQQNRHCIQIELNRRLYMDERTLQPTSGFQPLQNTIADFCSFIGEVVEGFQQKGKLRAAAE